jgi:hypothetical protein
MEKKIELTGRQVLKIKALAGEFPYDKDSKMKGENYRRFSYDGAVFIANTKDSFCTQFDKGQLFSADLELTKVDDRMVLSLLNNTSTDQEIGMAKTEATLNRIANFKPEAVDSDLLDSLA